MQNDFQNQSNKFLAKAAEGAATKAVMIGADIFRAAFNFLKSMLFSFLGK